MLRESNIGGERAVERVICEDGSTAKAEAVALTAYGSVARVNATFTRPADAVAYASGDLVANSTVAASVMPLTFDNVARTNGGSGMIRRARIRKSGTGTASASFRLHLFKSAPTVSTNGDNAVFGAVVSGVAHYLGALDVTVDRAFADGAAGAGAPITGSEIGFDLDSGDTIYGLLEARAAYAPVNGEIFNVDLEVIQS